MKFLASIAILLLSFSHLLIADKVVTTYIVDVQKERESTRFTLTEWLRIKERMKLMDVYLAMFSNPQTDKFHPEIGIFASQAKGLVEFADYLASPGNTATLSDLSAIENRGKAQLWLTNIISSTFGVRSLNIDFGLEYAQVSETASFPASDIKNTLQRGGVNFRIFGQHIQDSLFVLKYGHYEALFADLKLLDPLAGKMQGAYYGGEIQLYLLHWLGLAGEYTQDRKSVV